MKSLISLNLLKKKLCSSKIKYHKNLINSLQIFYKTTFELWEHHIWPAK